MNTIIALEGDVELIEVGFLIFKVIVSLPGGISLKKNRPRCCVKSPTAQDAFQPIPGLISCAGVTGRWGLLSCALHAARWLALSMDVCRW